MSWLSAIPALISLITELVSWIKQLQSTKKDADLKDYFNNMATIIREVKFAKTDVEKQAAAVKLRDLIGGM